MRRLIFLSVVIVFGSWSNGALAQTQNVDSLIMYRSLGGSSFDYKKDTVVFNVSPKQVMQILKKDDPLAYAEFKKAKSKSAIGGILGFTGVIMIAIPVISSIAGGNPEWGFAAGGAALIVGSIPISRSARRHEWNAVNSYNKRHSAFIPRADYYLCGAGAKIIIKF